MHKFGLSPRSKKFKCGRTDCDFVADSDRKLRIHLTKSGHTTSIPAEPAAGSVAQPLHSSGHLVQPQLLSTEQESEQAQRDPHETCHPAGNATDDYTTHAEADQIPEEVSAQHTPGGEHVQVVQGGTRNIQLDPLTGRFLAQAQAGPRSASQHKSEAIQAVEEDLQKEPSEPGLSEEEAALAQILLKLHVDDRTKLLQLLPRLAGTVRWRNASEFQEDLDGRSNQEWEKVKVGTSESGKEYFVWIRQDLSGEGGALARLLSRPGVAANDFKPIVQTSEEGQRVVLKRRSIPKA